MLIQGRKAINFVFARQPMPLISKFMMPLEKEDA